MSLVTHFVQMDLIPFVWAQMTLPGIGSQVVGTWFSLREQEGASLGDSRKGDPSKILTLSCCLRQGLTVSASTLHRVIER